MARRKLSPEKRYVLDRELVRAVEAEGISFQAFSSKLATKRRILRAYGYEYLQGKKEPLRLSECSDARITHTLQNTYEYAKRRVEEFEVTVRESDDYRNLVGLIEAEKSLEGDELVTARERTGIVMNSAPEQVLSLLSEKYGRGVMGEYYR